MAEHTRDDVYGAVVEVFWKEFEIPEVELHRGAHLVDDLDLDSLDVVTLELGLQERLGASLGDDPDYAKIQTVQDLVDVVAERLSEAGS